MKILNKTAKITKQSDWVDFLSKNLSKTSLKELYRLGFKGIKEIKTEKGRKSYTIDNSISYYEVVYLLEELNVFLDLRTIKTGVKIYDFYGKEARDFYIELYRQQN